MDDTMSFFCVIAKHENTRSHVRGLLRKSIHWFFTHLTHNREGMTDCESHNSSMNMTGGAGGESTDSAAAESDSPPLAKRGRSVSEVTAQAAATRDAVSAWVARKKAETARQLARHREEAVDLRAEAARLQTAITEAQSSAEALERTQNERAEALEQRQTALRAAECALKDMRGEQSRVEAAVAARTLALARRRAAAQDRLHAAQAQLRALQRVVDVYGQRLGLGLRLVRESSVAAGATVLRVSFTLLSPRTPAASASCLLYLHNHAFCGLFFILTSFHVLCAFSKSFTCCLCFFNLQVKGYEPSKPKNADTIVAELNEKQDLCASMCKLRAAFKQLFVPVP